MTKSEYQNLVEFLGRRFDAIDVRFDAIDVRFTGVDGRLDGLDGRMDGLDGRLTRVEVLQERDGHRLELVAEGVGALRDEMERRFARVDDEFRDMRDLIQASARAQPRR